MNNVKLLARRLYPLLWRLRTRGRIEGEEYIIATPARVRVEGAGTIKIGRRVMVERDARIIVRGRLVIGDDVYIGKNVTIAAFSSVTIADRVLVGENVSIHDEDHGPAGDRDRFGSKPVHIGADAWLCAGSVVTKGTSVGSRSTVAANAVVVRDIPPDVVAAGVPAKVVRELPQNG